MITLTTDFGTASPYVAAMKGVILAINPAAQVLDLSHAIGPQNLRQVDYFLAASIPFFPPGPIHVVVVDPGVGTARHLLYVELAGHRLVLPDNGCWTTLASRFASAPHVRKLEESRYWRREVSATFHGRDILAPVAAHLSLGVDPQRLGPKLEDWVVLETPQPRPGMNSITGIVLSVDTFGNLITNIPCGQVQPPTVLRVGKKTFKKFRCVRSYAEARPGELVVLTSSCGHVEIAVVQGNAAERLAAEAGTPVVIGWAR